MKNKRFEDLPVWRTALDLALRVYALADTDALNGPGDLRSQLCRASLSISNNIAEGFERGSTAELLSFLYIARGSAGEVRSILEFCSRWPRTANLKSEISDLRSLAESCGRQIRGWADNLQNSEIAGQRHLNEQSRRIYDHKQRAAAFMREIDESVRQQVAAWSEKHRQPVP